VIDEIMQLYHDEGLQKLADNQYRAPSSCAMNYELTYYPLASLIKLRKKGMGERERENSQSTSM